MTRLNKAREGTSKSAVGTAEQSSQTAAEQSSQTAAELPASPGLLRVPFPPLYRSDGKYSIGETIRHLRKEKGFSQEELARKAQVDRTTIVRVECGIFKSLSMEKLEGIAGAMGVALKALLAKAHAVSGEPLSYRGHAGHVEYALEYPEDGFRLVSHVPKNKEFFLGKIEIQPQKTVLSSKLPHPEQVYLHSLEGKMLMTRGGRESLLRPGDCFAFSGIMDYEIYNPDQFRPASSLFITYPSFLPV